MGIFKHWHSTLAGLATLALVGFHASQNPATLADPGTIAQVVTGIGLVFAADALAHGNAPVAGSAAPAAMKSPTS